MPNETRKYKRLQIGPIWLRTIIEIVLIITAIVICSYLTVRSYESTFYEATKDSARECTQQLSHSVLCAVDTELLDVSEPKRLDYVKKYYKDLFDECFIEGSIQNTCAIYTIVTSGADASPTDAVMFAGSKGSAALSGDRLSDALKVFAESAEPVSFSYDDSYYTYTPVFRGNEAKPCALLVVSSQYLNSFDYNSLVMERLKTIAVVSGVLIIVYYSISGAVSAYKKRKAVIVG